MTQREVELESGLDVFKILTTTPAYTSQPNKQGLIYYWSFNGNMRDTVGDAHLYGRVNAELINDRHSNLNAALELDDGYLVAPRKYNQLFFPI